MNRDRSFLSLAWPRPARSIVLAACLIAAAPHRAMGADAEPASNVALKLIAEGLGAPIALVPIPDGSGRLLVAEQGGVIHLLERDGNKSASPFLDVRGKLS